MPTVYRRNGNNGKPLKSWYFSYLNAEGKRTVRKGYTDKASTEALAKKLEDEARREREGLISRGERERASARSAPVGEITQRFREHLLRKGNTATHIRQTINALDHLFTAAGVASLNGIEGDKLISALGDVRSLRSARTANFYRGALRSFFRWLVALEILERFPSWVATLPPWNEKANRKRNRRALSDAEVVRLLKTAEKSPRVYSRREGRGGRVLSNLTGEDRAIAYLIAVTTGFRADEIRTLTPSVFALEGEQPSITVLAGFSKNGREDTQPIPRKIVPLLSKWIEGKPRKRPCLPLPEKTAEMIADDLREAGIPVETADGVIDFHSLRATFITNLHRRGVAPRTAMKLARHSTISLTLDTYTKVDDNDLRRAIEG